MTSIRLLSAAALALALACAGSSNNTEPNSPSPAVRKYGPAQTIGNGTVRTYIVLDDQDNRIPREVGVALSESAMETLPAAVTAGMGHENMPMMNMHMFELALPAGNPTQYKFVQFDWNPVGHEPAGVYDAPHFDFHFYTISAAEKNAIVPTDPQYATKAAKYPAEEFRAPFYIDAATPAQAPPAAVTVPQMGLHWLDIRSPELQGMAGHPENFKPFTKTYIYGSWDGQFIFDEPMITQAYLLAKKTATDSAVRDEIIPVSTPKKRQIAGFFPEAYRITYDAKAKEYRVAVTQLVEMK
ncbi:MAG TPA: DUF5602 domain-containing protein [Gemmatimonadaceae bacterium]